MGLRKIVYIVSGVKKSLAFEWIAIGLKQHFDITFILLNDSGSPFESYLAEQEIKFKRIKYRGKKDFLIAFIRTFTFLLISRPHAIHAHLLDAQIIGLTAARLAGIHNRIYTRHNSNYHHVYEPKGVKYDHWSNALATRIISISKATDITLRDLEKVAPGKVTKIPHGFNLSEFSNLEPYRTEGVKRKWGIENNHPVVGVIARHIEWKGIQYVIPAFHKFKTEYPDAVLILANAIGPFNARIIELVDKYQIPDVIMIPFEEDVAALYSTFDIYVHVPVDELCEAFGQTYIEALAMGVPSIFTLSGIATEFITHGRNALVVNYRDTGEMYKALVQLWENEFLRGQLKENGRQDVFSRFDFEPMLSALKNLYNE